MERLSEEELLDLESYCNAPPVRAFEPVVVRAMAELRELRAENNSLREALKIYRNAGLSQEAVDTADAILNWQQPKDQPNV